ncbi:4936_t:CDS:1, partial [Scutellospora calospora]
RADDSCLLGIPRLRAIIAMLYPHHDEVSKDYPYLPVKEMYSMTSSV